MGSYVWWGEGVFREEWSWWPKIPIVRSILNGASSDVTTEAMSTCLPPEPQASPPALWWWTFPDRKATPMATREKLEKQAFPWKHPSILLQRHIEDLYRSFPETRFWVLDGERIWSLGQRAMENRKMGPEISHIDEHEFLLVSHCPPIF